MNPDSVLLITDNLESAEMLAHGLVMRGLKVEIVAISTHLHQRDQMGRYMLVIVDTDTTDGVVLCRQLRNDYKNPLLFLTYEHDERYHLLVYEAGVDDCIQKPIGNALFLAKVDIWLRITRQYATTRNGNLSQRFCLDSSQHRLRLPEGNTVKLTTLEVRLFELFLRNPSTVLDTDTIIRRVWDEYGVGDSALLKNLIYRIRRKIEPDPSTPCYIQTTFHGYVFQPDSTGTDH